MRAGPSARPRPPLLFPPANPKQQLKPKFLSSASESFFVNPIHTQRSALCERLVPGGADKSTQLEPRLTAGAQSSFGSLFSPDIFPKKLTGNSYYQVCLEEQRENKKRMLKDEALVTSK